MMNDSRGPASSSLMSPNAVVSPSVMCWIALLLDPANKKLSTYTVMLYDIVGFVIVVLE